MTSPSSQALLDWFMARLPDMDVSTQDAFAQFTDQHRPAGAELEAHAPHFMGTDHVGITVPDMDQATAFFTKVLGYKEVFTGGPYAADDDWMKEHLNVHPRAAIPVLKMLRLGYGSNLELFEYVAPDQDRSRPKNSDFGGHHLAYYVADMAAAIAHLKAHDLTVLGAPTTLTSGASAGLTYVYFLSPWGLQLELVSYPNGLAYEREGGPLLWSPFAPSR